jgi:hypothetical protein
LFRRLNFYKNRLGLFEGATDIDELAKVIGCDTEALRCAANETHASCDIES